MCKAKLLVRFNVLEHFCGESKLAVFFGYFACGNSRAGLVPARANIIGCSIVDGAVGRLCLSMLRYDRRAFIETAVEFDICEVVDTCMLDIYTLDDWVDRLLSPSEAEGRVTSTTTCGLAYEEVGVDRFRVLGETDLMKVALLEDALAEQVAGQEQREEALDDGGDDAPKLWDDVLPRPRRPSRRPSTSGRRQRQEERLPEDIPIDGDEAAEEIFGMPNFVEELAQVMDEGELNLVDEARRFAEEFGSDGSSSSDEREATLEGADVRASSSSGDGVAQGCGRPLVGRHCGRSGRPRVCMHCSRTSSRRCVGKRGNARPVGCWARFA